MRFGSDLSLHGPQTNEDLLYFTLVLLFSIIRWLVGFITLCRVFFLRGRKGWLFVFLCYDILWVRGLSGGEWVLDYMFSCLLEGCGLEGGLEGS